MATSLSGLGPLMKIWFMQFRTIRCLLQFCFVHAIVFFIAIAPVDWANAGGGFVSVARLQEVLKSRDVDLITKTLNDVKSMSYQGKILPFIRELWDRKKEIHPDLPWEVINYEVVRLEIVDVLLQARNNDLIDFDPHDMVVFAREQINSRDARVRMTAILALGGSEDAEAIKDLAEIANRENVQTFRFAVVALLRMCHPNAKRALNEILNVVKKNYNKSFIKNEMKTLDRINKSHPICKYRTQN